MKKKLTDNWDLGDFKNSSEWIFHTTSGTFGNLNLLKSGFLEIWRYERLSNRRQNTLETLKKVLETCSFVDLIDLKYV